MLIVMDPDEARQALDALGQRRAKTDAASKAVAKDTPPTVEDGLRAGLGPAEIARRAGVTDAYVRRIRKKAQIPPNPKYDYLRPPRAGEPGE